MIMINLPRRWLIYAAGAAGLAGAVYCSEIVNLEGTAASLAVTLVSFYAYHIDKTWRQVFQVLAALDAMENEDEA